MGSQALNGVGSPGSGDKDKCNNAAERVAALKGTDCAGKGDYDSLLSAEEPKVVSTCCTWQKSLAETELSNVQLSGGIDPAADCEEYRKALKNTKMMHLRAGAQTQRSVPLICKVLWTRCARYTPTMTRIAP